MRTCSPSWFVAAVFAGAQAVAQGDLLYTVTTGDGLLRTVDPLTATTVSSVPISSGAGPAQQCNGIARNPISGQLYVLVRLTTGATRYLATLDPATGIATIVGPTSDNFAGIAFRVDGVLYGVTGDGAVAPESLFTINTANAQSTLVRAFGAGNNGETIAFAADLDLYHASGIGVPNVDEAFERFDAFTHTLTSVPLTGYDYNEVLSLTGLVGGNLLAADNTNALLVITTAGHVARIGTLDHAFVKGMAFVPSPNTQPFFRTWGNGCRTSAGTIPLLAGTGTPTPSASVQLHVLLAPVSSFGMLALGFGNGTLPIPSPGCQVQISPLGPASVGFVTTPAGGYSLPLQLPAGLQPMDAWLQAGMIDGSSFVVSNPLQVHLR